MQINKLHVRQYECYRNEKTLVMQDKKEMKKPHEENYTKLCGSGRTGIVNTADLSTLT